MNNNLTEIVFILDRSGSMEHLTTETIGGFNSLIERQKADKEGEALITTVLFDDQYEILHNHLPLKKVHRLTKKDYYARGCTALLDAIGKTIDSIGERLSATPEDKRPGKVLFIITTDGYENASQTYTKSKIKEMITHQQDVYNWQFTFLGANIDAVGEADSLGIRPQMACSPSASARGVKSSFGAMDKLVSFMRENKSMKSVDFAAACENAFDSVE